MRQFWKRFLWNAAAWAVIVVSALFVDGPQGFVALFLCGAICNIIGYCEAVCEAPAP